LEKAEADKQRHQQHWQDEEYRLYRMADVERRNGDDRRYNGGGGRGGGGYDRKRRARGARLKVFGTCSKELISL